MEGTMRFQDQVALVTGANSGIGRATALHLASLGHEVHGSVRNLDSAAKLLAMAEEAGVEVNLFTMDVADDESVRRGLAGVLERTGRVDVLVNNAGVGGNAVMEECPPSLYNEVFNINVCGAVRCVQAVLPGMRERRSGTIVNITSITGVIAAIAQQPYVASKWALEGATEGLAQEVAPFGIRVAIIEPGITKSSIFAKNVDAPNQSGAYDAHYRRLFQFYKAGLAEATDALEVAELIAHAITTDEPRLRYTVSWGGPEIASARRAMSDEEWVAMGLPLDDGEYYDRFSRAFGVDIRPKS
jgi:NAD(P)-dependent dehydrogenase (short-subunit alcohol dehydrogenase family)